MADTQITILGMSGSGKTCYLLGLYYEMGSGMRGFTITTDDDTDVKLRDRYAKMCDQSLGLERFPVGTDNFSKYEFNLQYGYNTVMTFDWMDYPGGVLERKNEGNLGEYEDLKSSINNSSTLFICVDGALLVGNNVDEKIDKVKDECSSVINTFFSDYLASNNEIPPTAIIVTKYDLCKNDTDEDELCEIIEGAFSPFFINSDDNKKRFVTIIPVSIGVNIMSDDCSGKLKPLNIHLPIFMAIWFSLIKKIQEQKVIIQDKKQEVQNDISSLRNLKAQEENKWFFKSESHIQHLAEQIQKSEQKDQKYTEEMDNLIKFLTKTTGKLMNELKEIPYVYINGERTSFNESIIKGGEKVESSANYTY